MKNVIKEVVANQDDRANLITKGKKYIVYGEHEAFYSVRNDGGYILWVFKNIFDSDLLSAARSNYKEAKALAERIRVRDEVAKAVRHIASNIDVLSSMALPKVRFGVCDLQGKEISSGAGWAINESDKEFKSNNFIPNENTKVLEQLREVLRVPEGESIVTHAKVVRALADALIGLQK